MGHHIIIPSPDKDSLRKYDTLPEPPSNLGFYTRKGSEPDSVYHDWTFKRWQTPAHSSNPTLLTGPNARATWFSIVIRERNKLREWRSLNPNDTKYPASIHALYVSNSRLRVFAIDNDCQFRCITIAVALSTGITMQDTKGGIVLVANGYGYSKPDSIADRLAEAIGVKRIRAERIN